MNCQLYLTSPCELCDQALVLLLDSGVLNGHSLETIDVANADVLFKKYGKRIPVFKVGSKELDWPFASEEVARSLQTE